MDDDCPTSNLHYAGGDQPTGYIAWASWADRKSETHKQSRCPGCDLFKIWTPR